MQLPIRAREWVRRDLGAARTGGAWGVSLPAAALRCARRSPRMRR